MVRMVRSDGQHHTGRACEVETELAMAHRDGDRDANVVVGHTVAFQRVAGNAVNVAQLRHARQRTATRVLEQRVARGAQVVGALARSKCDPAVSARRTRRALRREITAPLVGRANVRQHQAHHVLDGNATSLDANRRHDDAFLKQFGRALRHAAGTQTTDVRVVRPHGGEGNDLAIDADGLDHREVRQVRAASVWIVEQEHVARLRRASHHGAHGLRHGAEVHRNVRGLGDHSSPRVEQC